MKEDWMKELAGNSKGFEAPLEPAGKGRLFRRIEMGVRMRRICSAGALMLPLIVLVLFAPFSKPDSVFEPQAKAQGDRVIIGATGGEKPGPDTLADGKKHWYEMTNEEKIIVTRDSIRSRYGIKIHIPGGCRADYVDGGGFWMPNESMAGAWSPCFWPELAVTSHDKECVFLFEHTYAYNPRRIAINRKTGNKFPMRREVFWIFRGIKKSVPRSEKDFPADFNYKDYLSELPASYFWADTVYTYEVPSGRTTFCYSHPGDTARPHERPISQLEVLHQKRYPVLRRYYFIKEGSITYSAMAMMTERASKHLPRYERLLRRIIHYDPTVQYEDLSWYLSPEATRQEKARQDSIKARIDSLKLILEKKSPEAIRR